MSDDDIVELSGNFDEFFFKQCTQYGLSPQSMCGLFVARMCVISQELKQEESLLNLLNHVTVDILKSKEQVVH